MTTRVRCSRRPRIGVALATLVVLTAACASFDPDARARFATPRRGMVVCEHPLATEVGVAILEQGGNAADAAVATALALAVVLPRAGNLGGGGFAVWVAHDASEAPRVLDFRETAPSALTSEHFLDANGQPDPERSLAHALACGVPGSPAGLFELHSELGSMRFEDVAQPAVDLARNGFPIDAELARSLAHDGVRAHLTREGAADQLFYPGGVALAEGDLLVQEALARTIERFARRGPSGFYQGEVANALLAAVRAGDGVLSAGDLRDYEPVWREPLRGWFRGLEIITVPPPSSGGLVLLQVLSMLDGFPLDQEIVAAAEDARRMGRDLDPREAGLSGRAVHWWIEAMRRAFADRAVHMGDPDSPNVDVPVDELLSPEWVSERRVSISEFAVPDVAPLDLPAFREDGETTHLSVLDTHGNAVSLTTTLNTSFGNGLLVPGAGFFLNNEIDDFALFPGVPNAYGLVGGDANALEPRKRPLSSMTPTIVREGDQVVRWVLGSPGGPRIITAVIQVFLRCEVYGQSLADAVAAPRLHQQWNPPATRFEAGWDPLLLDRLRGRRHEVVETEGTFASVQAIRVDVGGEPVGVSDPRASGAVGAEGRDLVPAAAFARKPR